MTLELQDEPRCKRYPEYKDSGVEWIGEIPEGWEVGKCRNLFKFSKGLTITKDELVDSGIPCVSYGEVHSRYGFQVNPDRDALKCVPETFLKTDSKSLVENGDFIFADTSEDQEGSGNFTHLTSTVPIFAGYHTVIARQKLSQHTRYLAYLFDGTTFRRQIQRSVKGVKVFSITQSLLKGLGVVIPPVAEQTAIADFLDEKTAKIDEAIRQKERMIELLKERKQILIQQAVTGGLDPKVPMKDSGVEWIGQIPAHWEVKRVKSIFRLIIDPAEKNHDEELLSIYTHIGVEPRKDLEEKGNKASTTDGYWRVRKGDFIVNKLLAWMGAIGLSKYDGVTSPAYDILRPRNPLNGWFYHYLFRTPACSAELKRHSRGIMEMRLRLYFEKFGDVLVPHPPKVEQDAIIEKLEEKMTSISSAIERVIDQITKLREYRATLIDSAVTGKIKVTND